MIYGYLYLSGTKYLGNAAARMSGPTYFKSRSEADWQRNGWRDCPENHWWKIDFVGEYFRRELSEHYYRSNLFSFGDSFDLLSKFRVTDQWNLGFVPADVVTNVGVQIDCDGYDFDGLKSLQDPSPNNDVWGGATSNRRKPHSTLFLSLDQLSGFKKGTKVSIKFFVDNSGRGGTAGEVQQWLCDTVLPIVLPGVHRLISAGYVIHVVLAKTESWDDDDIVNEDFVFAGKTFEQDTIQSALDIVSLRNPGPGSNAYSRSSKRSSWRWRRTSKRNTTTSPTWKTAQNKTKAKARNDARALSLRVYSICKLRVFRVHCLGYSYSDGAYATELADSRIN
jgi:hypothetical protein